MDNKQQSGQWQLAKNSSAAYEEYLVPVIFAPGAKELIQFSELKPGDKLLDLACGTGIVARMAHQHIEPTGSIKGLDINKSMLEVAKETSKTLAPPIEWYQGDAAHQPFKENSFDMKTKQKLKVRFNGIMGLLGILFLSLLPVVACNQVQSSPKEVLKDVDNEVVIDLNELTYNIAYEHDSFYSLIGIRTLTMVHLAIHDALNAVVPKYEAYAYSQKNPGADPIVAASEAARKILLAAYPKRADTINLVCNKWINVIEASKAKKEGTALGDEIALTYLELRKGDGHQKQGDYTPMSKPGDYQYTPGWDGYVLKPDFDYARPFAMDTVCQLRSPPPPDINSKAYTKSYKEVKAYGKKNSKVRSGDQTNYAHWWAEFAEHSGNRIGRITAKEHHLPIRETARMFALINMDIYDIYLASLESKYVYDTWRPYTAIRQGDADGNRHTEADPEWMPEMQTPPWPEYPSAHASVAAGGAEILTHVYGTPKVSFTMESVAALPTAKTRTYHDLDSAAMECADSRVMNGFHFRFATEEGMTQGRNVARYIISNFLRPLEKN